MFKKLISIHKLCPQSVLKHSVDHFQRYWNEHFIFLKKKTFFSNLNMCFNGLFNLEYVLQCVHTHVSMLEKMSDRMHEW